MYYLLLYVVLLIAILVSLAATYYRFKRQDVIAFFHPYCNDGGGGERVLWWSVKCVQELNPNAKCVIYTGNDNVDPQIILQKVRNHFNIQLDTRASRISFIFLTKRYLVEDKSYPHFTLIGQSLGSIGLALEALNALSPAVFIDTMGYAFTFPVFKLLAGSKVGCYVHYPTISSDMLSMVFEKRPSYNNNSQIAKSSIKTYGKYFYYKSFAKLYGFMGSFADSVMVNSSWTKNHIDQIWGTPRKTQIVFPPCNTDELARIPLSGRKQIIISISQFRPEKDHNLQLNAFKAFSSKYPQWNGTVKMVFIGSSRNEGDEARLDGLRQRCKKENIQNVEFEVNVPFSKLKEWLSEAMIGVHTMWNEHFGIGVVEFMAAGVIPVAHNSGGPKEDIVVDYQGQRTGFLASKPEEYADHFHAILSMKDTEREAIQINARNSATRFSDAEFTQRFNHSIRRIYQ